MKILEKMLEVETEARQIVENAKGEANTIRKNAREEAKQLVIKGKKDFQDRMQEEIKQIEEEAATRKAGILKEMETHLAEMERRAKEQVDRAVDHVMTILLEK